MVPVRLTFPCICSLSPALLRVEELQTQPHVAHTRDHVDFVGYYISRFPQLAEEKQLNTVGLSRALL